MNTPATYVARPEDSAQLAWLQTEFNQEFQTPCPPLPELTQRLGRLLAGEQCFAILCGAPDDPAGHAIVTLRPTIYFDGPLAVLDELYVRPTLRDQSFGTAMMRHVMDELRRRESRELHINVDEDDTHTRRFYECLGFRNHEPGSEWRMLLYLRELPPAG